MRGLGMSSMRRKICVAIIIIRGMKLIVQNNIRLNFRNRTKVTKLYHDVRQEKPYYFGTIFLEKTSSPREIFATYSLTLFRPDKVITFPCSKARLISTNL